VRTLKRIELIIEVSDNRSEEVLKEIAKLTAAISPACGSISQKTTEV
jgi:hypothetical protein